MSDLYQEILISRETPFINKVAKIAAYVVTALFLFAGFMFLNIFLLIIGAVMAVCCYIFLPRLDVEYEYLYVNGELDIDAIYSKQKREDRGL